LLAVAQIVQLSDLHLLGAVAHQRRILDALVEALRRDRQWRGTSSQLLAITGDVFDSGTIDPPRAAAAFRSLHDGVKRAIGDPLTTVVVPGNHDRRTMGLFGPHRDALFEELARSVGDDVWVHGRQTPFLAEVLPQSIHGLPLWVVAYDSTYLPRGLLSAGGVMRQEDLLRAASVIGDQHLDWPVLFLLHHHLVPTPLTDMGVIDAAQAHPVVRWGIQQLLPRVVAHADREELTMTALGAGTALSTLQSLGRAVVVLHGHKHYPSARLLGATREAQGDVLLISAGSAGSAQTWNHDSWAKTARLWPSFNVIEIEREWLSADVVSFGYKGRSNGKPVRRPLARARRRGWRWEAAPVPERFEEERRRRLASNHARYQLRSSRLFAERRWDLVCHRQVLREPGVELREYVETLEALDGARLTCFDSQGCGRVSSLPMELSLTLDGQTRYDIEGGLFRTWEEARRLQPDRASPFAWVGLMNRYASDSARLLVEGLGARSAEAFASATDLGTGLERPVHLDRSSNRVVLDHPSCPPRTLLRVYWALD
jgi:3',5'-cyclic AMP phosphodiesterase CpdA